MKSKPYTKRITNPSLLKLGFIAIIAPTLTTLGIGYEDITSWDKLFDVMMTLILNPYLLGTTITGFLIFLMDNKPEPEEEEVEKKGG